MAFNRVIYIRLVRRSAVIPLEVIRGTRKFRLAVISAKNHKRQRRKRQPVTAKREKSQTPKVFTALLKTTVFT